MAAVVQTVTAISGIYEDTSLILINSTPIYLFIYLPIILPLPTSSPLHLHLHAPYLQS